MLLDRKSTVDLLSLSETSERDSRSMHVRYGVSWWERLGRGPARQHSGRRNVILTHRDRLAVEGVRRTHLPPFLSGPCEASGSDERLDWSYGLEAQARSRCLDERQSRPHERRGAEDLQSRTARGTR